jgi:hypothetical protein
MVFIAPCYSVNAGKGRGGGETKMSLEFPDGGDFE